MHNVNFEYSFSSGLGCYEHSRFITITFMEIVLTDDYGVKTETIGNVEFLIVNIDEAINAEYSLFDILDGHSEYLARHVFEFFDPETGEHTEKIEGRYLDFTNRNFLPD